MNRLVIIGNGFDLAHNLKTKYSDFLLSYLKDCFLKSEKNNIYEDDFIKIVVRHISMYSLNPFTIDEAKGVKDFMRFLNQPSSSGIYFASGGERDFRSHEERDALFEKFILKIKDEFFLHLFKNACDLTWVDIEREYYESLKKTFEHKSDKKPESVKQLNNSFEYLKKLLVAYISKISLDDNLNDEIFNCLNADIDLKEIPTIKDKEQDEISKKYKGFKYNITPLKTMYLNFNYTQCILKYLNSNKLKPKPDDISLNNIHGTTTMKEIIFGYGDEMDDNYKQLEYQNNNEYLKFAKSFGYFNNTYYHSLIRFLDSDKFELQIMGHSCGLSDRTLLNMIFEHDNCKSIKIYYYQREDGSNDFSEKTMEISRHFRNKHKMRERILPFDKCVPLPQLNITK